MSFYVNCIIDFIESVRFLRYNYINVYTYTCYDTYFI
jgi:hypothetical protein